METMTTLRVSPQGQITIPKGWQKILSLNPGKKVVAWLKKGIKGYIVTLMPEPKSWVDYMAGLGKDVWKDIDTDEYLKKERDSWERKWH